MCRVVSPHRDFDLTPCFEEGILLQGLLAAVALLAVFRSLSVSCRPPLQLSRKSTLYLRAKIALLFISVLTSTANVVLIVLQHKSVPVLPSYILEPFTFAVILVFTYFNHTHTRTASTVLLIFWPLYITAVAVWTRTIALTGAHPFIVILALRWTAVGIGAISFAIETMGSQVDAVPSDKLAQENPLITANIYSVWTFAWMTPLMKKGASRFITEDDLFPLVPSDESVNLGNDLKKAMEKHTLWKALFVAYGGPYAVAAGLKIIQDMLAFLQPQLLRLLLAYISLYQETRFKPEKQPSSLEGFAIAIIMFIASCVQTIALNQYFQRTFETGMRVRAGLVTAIYTKALVLSNDERTRASGDIVNLMSVDATRLQDLCTYGLIAISGPLQITLAFISLYDLLGWSAFVGVAIMVISIPLNTFIARILKRMQEQQMKNRDKRTRLMSELLANIKSIKLYAWEYSFIRKIAEVRNNQELKMLKKIGIVTSWNMALWSGIPLLVAFSSFATAALTSSKPLTSDIIFPAISLFMLLQFPLAMFSQVTSNIIEAIVSVQRLSSFLTADELQEDARKLIDKPDLQVGDEVLSIKDADFAWSKNAVEPTLEGISLTVKKGELVGILGRVGSGKTSLLSAIIGEMSRKEGEVVVTGSVAYAPQNPWILSATVRDNILFSHEYDETFYNLVIEGCALKQDLALLANGDLTEVGEKGITLSGGQRARISLARAVYARADLTLLDDCLAAVDSHVARHVFDNVIGPNGILATKGRILVTNSIAFISQFDTLAFVRRGIVLEQGSYMTLLANPNSEIAKLVKGHGTGSGSSTPFGTSGSATPKNEEEIVPTKEEEYAVAITEKLRHRASFEKARIIPAIATHKPSGGLTKEHQEQGRVKIEVYKQYIQAASKAGFAFFLFATIAQQAASVLATLTLRYWGEHNRESGNNSGMFKYLLIYGCFSLSSSLLGALSAITMWVYCSLRSAKRLHDSMLEALMRAPLSFFELTPTGRILNLFSRDMYVVDQILARVIQGLCRTLAICLSIVAVIGGSFPPFLIALFPLGWFYLRVMKYYLATSRELKRIDAVTRSPIFAWFSESLAGLSTIRAFHQQTIFVAANQKRIDHNQICYLPSISVNRWLSVRLEFVGALIILTVAFLAMSALITSGVDAGLVGLVLSYALNTTSSLNWVVRSASEVEQNIVSVERVLHQTEVQSEASQEIPENKPAGVWPSEGAIEFRNYSTQYRPGLDLILKNINLKISPKEKIGICGRTGAGKSSLLLALFRIIEPVTGTILIDSIDVTKVGLHDLRSGLSIVPQSPDLFEGTLRENIDPVGEYSDADIWIAIEQAHLKDYIESLPEKLDAPVREGGSSLSSGQRQLLCFARALLRKSKILVLDEATSAVDLDTDQAIQEIIHGPAFTNVTMLTIAHRLNTILESDRVVVMDAGTVAEVDTPTNLLNDSSSIFHSLAKEAGIISYIS
ncbi:multidrug resistance-associated ABC transporter [Pholiota conissans]|uniref:Multidrug resistance-associated ABC transporter n=1 Tax=Pholiota conissans TaxID=109636 RepID=A0A9P5YRI6_9AGAR|nr:multidrug resistance-associated ABC transporter [Pholiota conissans]